VYSASFSPDGSRIVTATDDGTVRVWDARRLWDDTPDARQPAEKPITSPAPSEATVELKFLPSAAMPKAGPYWRERVVLRAEKPKGLARAPELTAPLYGVLSIGPRESPAPVIVAVDEPKGQPAKLYVDSNANGDLTDEPAREWKLETIKHRQG